MVAIISLNVCENGHIFSVAVFKTDTLAEFASESKITDTLLWSK